MFSKVKRPFFSNSEDLGVLCPRESVPMTPKISYFEWPYYIFSIVFLRNTLFALRYECKGGGSRHGGAHPGTCGRAE